MIAKKVILIGHFGVGKTSLVARYVHQKFSEKYITTIGVKIDKKELVVEGTALKLLIWDLAGEDNMAKVPANYKMGAHGIIYVFDCANPTTYQALPQHLADVKSLLPAAPAVVVGNKKDLVAEKELHSIRQNLPLDNVYFSSAKTGEHVEELFLTLARQML